MHLDNLLTLAIDASTKAGEAILKEKKDLKIWQKDDDTPVSSADLTSNAILNEILGQSDIAICSEEKTLAFELRKNLPYFWLLDPLDGTKGFLNGSDEYCILIALIKEQRPILALIYQPQTQQILYAHQQSKVFKNHKELKIDESIFLQNKFKALVSAHHQESKNKAFLQSNKLSPIKIASALKFNALCEGQAGVYVRFESLHSWDIAAGDFLLNQSGGFMCDFNQKPLLYNQKSFSCPHFIALSRKAFFKDFDFSV